MMRLSSWVMLGALLLAGVGRGAGQQAVQQDSLGARIWLDRGDDAVLHRGDQVSVYYETSADAYVAIFHIDTDGSVQLLYPQAPDADHFVQGNRDYQLLFPRSPYWYVDEYPGTGYYFIVASLTPLDFSDFGYSPYEHGWDLTQVGRTVYRDPYTAMDDYVSRLIPDWRTANYGLDFLTYYVGRVEPYPRFLCYECHEFRPYTDWNPYAYACSTFRLVIWDDPYFSPEARYDGSRIVFPRAEFGRPRFQFKERARGEAWSPLVRHRPGPTRHMVQFAEPTAAPPPTIASPPRRRSVPMSSPGRGATLRRSLPGGAGYPDTQRSGASRPGQILPGRQPAKDRPILQRRTTIPTMRSRPSDAVPPSERPKAGRRSGGGVVEPRSAPRRPNERSGGGRPEARPAPRRQPERPVIRPRSGGGRPEARPIPRRQPERPAIRPRSGGGSRTGGGGGRFRGRSRGRGRGG